MNFLCWQNVRREREMSVTINYNCQGGKFREYVPKAYKCDKRYYNKSSGSYVKMYLIQLKGRVS